jgi:NAD(P)-dependent dehydrogenase (short-subunit alcohol dehydrogenase family)
MGICDGRVVIVTGAGRGIGREHALLLAREGAMVVVNDLGGAPDGSGSDLSPAQQVVAEIEAMGGAAIANGDDVSSWSGAEHMIREAVDTFDDLHVLVNNAGILRDRMLVNMTEAEWDAVIQVHLKGTFAPARHAAAYWRERHKAGKEVDARIINTTSVSGIYGNPGQTNYGAAKMGIAAFSIIAAQELSRIGVTVNAISPGALTRLTENLMGEVNDELRESRGPNWIAPICAWLASPLSRNVTGRVFQVAGDEIAIAESWHKGPVGLNTLDPEALTPVIADLMARARLNADMNGDDIEGPGRPGHAI